jgi:hypothetical protein
MHLALFRAPHLRGDLYGLKMDLQENKRPHSPSNLPNLERNSIPRYLHSEDSILFGVVMVRACFLVEEARLNLAEEDDAITSSKSNALESQ